jgi:NAD+ diphosphatase
MSDKFVPAVHPPEPTNEPSWWFIVRKDRILVSTGPDQGEGEPETGPGRVPLITDPEAMGLDPLSRHYLGTLGTRQVWTAETDQDQEPPDGWDFCTSRELFTLLNRRLSGLAGRAVQIIRWDRNHRFCGRCGEPTEPHPEERAKVCSGCGLAAYPVISPAVIVAVRREDRLLLARSPHFPGEMHSVLAGFNEPGESLEETIRREIKEEVGLEIKDIKYFGSQPWPFPHTLMIGFTARWAGGEIVVDGQEIEAAGWYRAGEMPRLPAGYSIARLLIDDFLSNHGG